VIIVSAGKRKPYFKGATVKGEDALYCVSWLLLSNSVIKIEKYKARHGGM
jgi:hypothetical protein